MNIKSSIRGFYIHAVQQEATTKSGRKIKYIYNRYPESKGLVVVFSAFSEPPARYNYIGTLKNLRENKLFILDDWGRIDYPGVYYLGWNGDYILKEEVIDFIKSITMRIGSDCRLTMLGSSKGGWCALYYGLRMGADTIIAGAPQYYLGNYLDCDFHKETFDIMMGDDKLKNKDILNNLLPNVIRSCRNRINVFLHYSECEHTYYNHIKDLCDDLSENDSINLYTDIQHYNSHGEVGCFFPFFVKNLLKIN